MPIEIEVIFSFVLLSAPVWVPAVLVFLPARVAKYLFLANAVVALPAMVFFFKHGVDDQSRWQWESAGICMSAFWCLLAVGLGLVAIQLRKRYWPGFDSKRDAPSFSETDGSPEPITPTDSENPYRSPRT